MTVLVSSKSIRVHHLSVVRVGIQSLEFFIELNSLFSLSLLIRFNSWLLKRVVLICEGISELDVLGNPTDT